tara:strand:- start:62 stop:247 length:186 start_codon:yes stop_codon:yes gene_type:complete
MSDTAKRREAKEITGLNRFNRVNFYSDVDSLSDDNDSQNSYIKIELKTAQIDQTYRYDYDF